MSIRPSLRARRFYVDRRLAAGRVHPSTKAATIVAVNLNWLIEHPWLKTLIALSAFGKFRVARNAKLGHGELWSAALEEPTVWSYVILGSAYGSEEEARGACRDYAEVLCAERGVPTRTWPFIRRAG